MHLLDALLFRLLRGSPVAQRVRPLPRRLPRGLDVREERVEPGSDRVDAPDFSYRCTGVSNSGIPLLNLPARVFPTCSIQCLQSFSKWLDFFGV